MSDSIGVGIIGQGFMGRAHAHALRTLEHLKPPRLSIRLAMICGQDAARVAATAEDFGFESSTTQWEELVAAPAVDVVAVLTPNHLHHPMVLGAIAAGKHVVCEKPLGLTPAESAAMLAEAERASLLHTCGFNYRFVPAVRLASKLIAEGEIGEIAHFRGQYLQDWGWTAPWGWHFEAGKAGTGSIGDYVHTIDLARFLVGEVESVSAVTTTAVGARDELGPAADGRRVDVDDAYAAVGAFAGGGLLSLEASRLASGRKARHFFEVNGSAGSIYWDLEDLNRLHVYLVADGITAGFRDILVTEPGHPFLDMWWPTGHPLGWEHTFVHQWNEILISLASDTPLSPEHPTFIDGWRADLIVDAIANSAGSGRRVSVPTPPATTARDSASLT